MNFSRLILVSVLSMMTYSFSFAQIVEEYNFYSDDFEAFLGLKKENGVIRNSDNENQIITLRFSSNNSIEFYSANIKLATLSSDGKKLTVYKAMRGGDFFDDTIKPGTYTQSDPSPATVKRIHRWAGKKRPSKMDGVTKNNDYVGNALDEIEALYDRGIHWQPSSIPEVTDLKDNQHIVATRKFKSAGKEYTVYLLGTIPDKGERQYINQIYLLPAGYRRVYVKLPPRDKSDGSFYWFDALNTPPEVFKFIHHIKNIDNQDFVGALVHERVYNPSSDKTSIVAYEIKLPDDMGKYILSIYGSPYVNPALLDRFMFSPSIPDYSLMQPINADNLADAESKGVAYYKNKLQQSNPSNSRTTTQANTTSAAKSTTDKPTTKSYANTYTDKSIVPVNIASKNISPISFVTNKLGLIDCTSNRKNDVLSVLHKNGINMVRMPSDLQIVEDYSAENTDCTLYGENITKYTISSYANVVHTCEAYINKVWQKNDAIAFAKKIYAALQHLGRYNEDVTNIDHAIYSMSISTGRPVDNGTIEYRVSVYPLLENDKIAGYSVRLMKFNFNGL